MPYCEGSNSAVVTITLNGNSARVISIAPPVDYTLKELREPGQCEDVNYSLFAWFQQYQGAPQYRTGIVSWTGRVVSVRQTEYRVFLSYIGTDGFQRDYQYPPPGGTQWALDRGWEILPTFGQPDDCGDLLGCELTVTDQSGVIWRSSGDTCPSVSVQCGDECCPNQQPLEAQMDRILAHLERLKKAKS